MSRAIRRRRIPTSRSRRTTTPRNRTTASRKSAATIGAFPSTAKLSTPVSRTIHIECRGDCLILKPDFGNPQPRVIPFGPRTADSVDKLVAAVWDYTKGWGIAGRQMYWKPRLELELGLSGEGRYSRIASPDGQQRLGSRSQTTDRRGNNPTPVTNSSTVRAYCTKLGIAASHRRLAP